MIIADKDDLFVKSLLLESEYKFDREEVSEEDWPEFSFWEGDQDSTENHIGGKKGDLVNTEKQRTEKVNQEEVTEKKEVGTSPNNCWQKAVASGQNFWMLKNTFWHCWLSGAI